MNILITGANGFIGKHLTREMLNHGNEVYAIVSNLEDMVDFKDSRLHCFELLFENYSLISSLVDVDIDIAYHLAWCGLSGKSARDVDTQLSNVIATKSLLTQLKNLSTKKIVFSSTMNILELNNILNNPTEHRMRGVHVHVATKEMVEVMTRIFCDENNIEYNEGIIAMAYGEGNKSNMITNVFIYSMIANFSPNLVEGNTPYDLIYVKDIARALWLIGVKGRKKKSYYVGHEWDRTFKEIFTEIKNILNPTLELNFGSFKDESCIDFAVIDRKALKNDTGWEPQYDFKETILRTAEWLKNEGLKF